MIGSYETDGGKLSIQNPGATMMACPEALMKQEQKLLKLLSTVQSYRIDKTGALVLTTSDKKTIVARRP